ncbi:O-antigen ligase family protein [Methylobacterium sp. A54F]
MRGVSLLRTLPPVAIGAAAAGLAVALAAAPLKFAVVGLAAAVALLGALVVGQRHRLVPFLLVGLAVGLTVKLDVSFLQHYEAVGQYLPSVGGGAGLTVSLPILASLGLLAIRLTGLTEGAPGPVRLDPPLVLAQLAFLGAGVLSVVNAGDTTYLWFDELRFLNLLILFVAVSNLGPGDVRFLALAICALCLVQTAVAVLQVGTGSELGLGVLGEESIVEESIDFSTRKRAAGLKVHPNILGYYYEIVWPLALALALSRGPRLLRLVGAAGALAALAGVVLTLSRAAWGTFPLSALLVAVLVYRDRLTSRASLRVMALLIVAGGIAAVFVGPTIWERIFADDGGSASQRGPLNAAALALFRQFPVFGVGLNNFGNMFATLDTTGASRTIGLFERSNHVVHNLHLLVLTEVGIVGYAAFAAVFGLAILRGLACAWRAPVGDPLAAVAAAGGIGLLAHLLHGLVDPGFRLNLGIAELIYTLMGLIAAASFAQGRPISASDPATRDGAGDRGRAAHRLEDRAVPRPRLRAGR